MSKMEQNLYGFEPSCFNFIVCKVIKFGYSWKMQNHMETCWKNSSGKPISVWFFHMVLKSGYSWKMQNRVETCWRSSSGKSVSVWFFCKVLKSGYSWKMQNRMETSRESGSGKDISVWKSRCFRMEKGIWRGGASQCNEYFEDKLSLARYALCKASAFC